MEKVRVYELAKELNTTSKRLMEKLAEINIFVKNHMSLLEDHELEALYKHIGVIRHDDKKASEAPAQKAAPAVSPQPKPEVKKDAKSAPRIIRTTEIVINTKDEMESSQSMLQNYQRGGDNRAGKNDVRYDRNDKNNIKRDYIRVSDANTGLRAGFVRDTRPDYLRDPRLLSKLEQHKDEKKEAPKKEAAKEAAAETAKQAAGHIAREAVKAEGKKEAVKENVQTAAPEVKEAPAVSAARNEEKAAAAKSAQEAESIKEAPAAAVQPETNAVKHEAAAEKQDEAAKTEAKAKEKAEETAEAKQKHEKAAQPQQQAAAGQKAAEAQPQQDDKKQPQVDRPQQPQGKPGPGDKPQAQQTERKPAQGEKHGDKKAQADRPQQSEKKAHHGGQQSDRPQHGDKKPQGGFRGGQRSLDIPKPDLSLTQKEELTSQRGEGRREFQVKDIDRETKREQKREVSKSQLAAAKNKKFKPQNLFLSEKKGVHEILSEDFILDEFYSDEDAKKKKAAKPKKDKEKEAKATAQKHIPPKAVLTSITIPESITVKDLAEALKKTSTEVIKKLMGYGIMATLNQEVDFDTATIIAEEFGVKTEKAVVVSEEDILFEDDDENADPSNLQPRPPVVVVMGHVDHGKTSLLDAIRQTNVTDTEAGGITQHIGAYTVKINDRNITFLDTPGHEAFTAMRARGAQVTDIAILVVAADDGVMPQTVEAINHAKAAKVSIIVAINKIDKPGANPEKVKQELTEYGLVPEEWGGDVICVNVSAKKRQNIDQLLEMILLTADILELKADPTRQAKGTVIEAKLDKNRGPIATVLVQRGTLKVGDSIITGTTVGRIRAMNDDKGNSVKKAGPSTPVEILGLPEVPEAGELFYVIKDEKLARQLVEKRKQKLREQNLKTAPRVSLEDLYSQIKEGKVKELNIIVKADVQGSVEAVKQSFEKLSNDEVRVNIIHGGVGAITESDVTLAEVSNAIITGFNVRPGPNVAEAAQKANVDIRLYRVIYNAIEDIQNAMKGMLEPTFKEVILGHTEVRQIFKVSGVGTIAGCYVTDGKIVRNSDIRVVRDGIVVHEGKLASLKRFKDDVREVVQGFECGLSIERFNDIKEGDIIEVYTMEEVKR